MSELRERKIEFKLKSGPKRIRNCRKPALSSSLRRSADLRSKPRLRRQSSSQQSASRENSRISKTSSKRRERAF